ncbi:hypothetical protein ACMFMF_009887 [Clarireedia jacksonii]
MSGVEPTSAARANAHYYGDRKRFHRLERPIGSRKFEDFAETSKEASETQDSLVPCKQLGYFADAKLFGSLIAIVNEAALQSKVHYQLEASSRPAHYFIILHLLEFGVRI